MASVKHRIRQEFVQSQARRPPGLAFLLSFRIFVPSLATKRREALKG